MRKRPGSGISLIEMAVVLGLLVGIAMVMLIVMVGRSERQEQIYEERQQQVLQASGLDMEEHARDRLSDLINDNLMSMDRTIWPRPWAMRISWEWPASRTGKIR